MSASREFSKDHFFDCDLQVECCPSCGATIARIDGIASCGCGYVNAGRRDYL